MKSKTYQFSCYKCGKTMRLENMKQAIWHVEHCKEEPKKK